MIKQKMNDSLNSLKINNMSVECILVCLYFLCLPFTVVTTPLGSLLKIVTMPIKAIMLVFGDIVSNKIH